MPVPVDRSLRLPESEYFADAQAKSGIALHHTVCDDARTTLDIWRRDKTKTGKRRRVATAYVIDRANADSWRAQKGRLLEVDSLGLVVAALQDSITRLTAANALAYRTGYDAAFAGYQDLSRRYVAELRKPPITFGNAIGLIAAAGAGFLVGRTIP